MAFTVVSALRWWARECPERVALWVDGEPMSYADLSAASARVGAHLGALGVRTGDRIVTMASNSMEYAVLALGVVRIGAIFAPISTHSSAREIAQSLSALAPAVLFADAERQAIVREALGGAPTPALRDLREIRSQLETSEPIPILSHEPAEDDPIFIIRTSGSTGPPKGVVETHRTVVAYSAEFVLMQPRCGSGASALVVGPFSSSSGTLLLMQFVVAGNTIYLEKRFEPQRALKLLANYRITIFLAASVFFERIAALNDFVAADLSGLYFSQIGGSRIPASLIATWQRKGVILRQAYGCTEAGGAWAAGDDTATSAPDKCGHGAMFTDFAVRAEGGGFAAAGVPGEILIRGPSQMPGYWQNPDETSTAIKAGWLHTGDLGVVDENGNLTVIDRIKDIIISGGLNIAARELENVIAEVSGVEEVAVIGVADADFGETPLAVVHGDPDVLSEAMIVDYCAKQLARYKIPRYVVLTPELLPRLPSGKISKVELRKRYRDSAMALPKVR